jgi:hypothetical protein
VPVSSNLPGMETSVSWTGRLDAQQSHHHSKPLCSRCKGPRALWWSRAAGWLFQRADVTRQPRERGGAG